jgi:hypothetical protein
MKEIKDLFLYCIDDLKFVKVITDMEHMEHRESKDKIYDCARFFPLSTMDIRFNHVYNKKSKGTDEDDFYAELWFRLANVVFKYEIYDINQFNCFMKKLGLKNLETNKIEHISNKSNKSDSSDPLNFSW